ncbi:MAG: lipoyl(octanoyl) transferase LipB [Thiobacillaceae bacterium]
MDIQIKRLGQVAYEATWCTMQAFTASRDEMTADELWVLEHPPIFTLGQAGRREHLLVESSIPVLAVDRGGQVTYHGPGQVVIYVLVDLKRRGYGVKELVTRMEQGVIDLLGESGIVAARWPNAPGVYVQGAKIAALGLRVKQSRTYHGLALNVNMDLTPFSYINPCGYAGLAVTQTRDLGVSTDQEALGNRLSRLLATQIGI